jgi:membrane-bound lytic murein transglycosylase B
MQKIVLILVLFYCTGSSWAADPFFNVREQLVHDGFEPSFVSQLYQQPLVTFSPDPILVNFQIRESQLNYAQFLTSASVFRCKVYLQEHRKTLGLVKRKYGIAPEVIVAILMVETKLGSYTGTYKTLNVLSSFAAAAEPDLMKSLYGQLPHPAKKQRNFRAFESFCVRKYHWAYSELKALLSYTQETRIPAYQVMGSVSGAVGFPQFLPSSMVKYARDGDLDGMVNLSSHADAMASVANFLKNHGWRENLSIDEQKKVLFNYNRSMYYVNTVLALARKLKG